MSRLSSKYRVLIAHNEYQFYGGEDAVVESELNMLKKNGHEVSLYSKSNTLINPKNKIALFANATWSNETTKQLEQLFRQFKPDVIHVHNTLPLISPSIYWVANKFNIPVVQTIHNFRLACLQAMFLRKDKVCEDCKSRIPWRGALRKCYKNSYSASAALAVSLFIHKLLSTYKNKITIYIALNEFCKNKLIEMGLPERRIIIKPNFIVSNNKQVKKNTGNPLFVGRLSKEKGVDVLAKSINSIPNQMFDIVGDGPERSTLENIPNANLLGSLDHSDIMELMKNAPFLVLPSIWYENMPRTIVESFSNGTPVIASDIGALSSLIDHGKTGLLFEVGSSSALVEKIKWALSNNDKMKIMEINARQKYEVCYTEDVNYRMLIDIYSKAIEGVS